MTLVTSPEYDPAHSAALKEYSQNIANYNLPQLSDPDAAEVYERISEEEQRLAARGNEQDGYDAGTATVDDEIYVVRGTSVGLLTAEHATTQMRNGEPKDADWGTAGLGSVVQEDTGVGFVAAIGRQTSDANYYPEHPLKIEVQTIVEDERPLVIAGLHGMAGGKFAELTDTKPFDIFIGIGNEPSERSTQLAEAVCEIAADLGLRLGINQKFVKLDSAGNLAKRKDGQAGIAYNNFKAAGENTTRSFEQSLAEELGYDPALMQVELSSLLRRQPNGLEHDPRTRIMGAYLGYLFVKQLVELGSKPEL